MRFQINQLLDRLERDEADVEELKEQILNMAEPFMEQIAILTSMKGVGVFIAIAIIADIIEVSRFKDGKNRILRHPHAGFLLPCHSIA